MGAIYFLPKMEIFFEENDNNSITKNKFATLFDTEASIKHDNSYQERSEISTVYRNIFFDNPFLGSGSGTSKIRYCEFTGVPLSDGFSPHNTFLGIFIEHGILGFMTFLYCIITNLISAYRSKSKNYFKNYLVIILFPIILTNMYEFNLYPGQVFFWITFMFFMFPRLFRQYE